MIQLTSLVLMLLIAFSKVDSNSALICYECSQPKGLGLACETNVESVTQTTCATDLSCVKYVWTNAGSSVIHRHCTSLTCVQLGQNSTQFNTLESCETCYTDLCNKASPTKMSLMLIPLMYTLFRFL
ncbi:uncharacterized protein LOC108904525 [Anoplophora glabripennis]|uniref:uncharacterized protein LOC108904525 n=1 Tax=Anoplophora glabripennis TaxID=217634 RepID=UPI000873CA12|nr:uncharacterized protein LOC108904525 [Anoplophora glabripennis]